MWINSLHIDHFGSLKSEQSVLGLSPGINIFLGHNEAGKSTSLAFIQSMFFGFTRGRKNLDHAASARARRSHGSISLTTQRLGSVSLSRDKEQSILSDAQGNPLGEDAFNLLLGGVTNTVFDNVFAFSLTQLSELDSLTGDQIRHALHGASFGLGQISPAKILENINKQHKSLFNQRGKPESALLLQELEECRTALAHIGNEAQLYQELQKELQDIEQHVAELTAQREQQTREQRKVLRQTEVSKYGTSLRKLLAQEPEQIAGIFDAHSLSNLESLLERKDEYRAALVEQEDRIQREEEHLRHTLPNPISLRLRPRILAACERKQNHRSLQEKLPQLLAEAKAQADNRDAALQDLGPYWTIERLQGQDRSLFVREQIETFRTKLEHADNKEKQNEEQYQRVQKEYLQSREALEKAHADAGMLPLPHGKGWDPILLLTETDDVAINTLENSLRRTENDRHTMAELGHLLERSQDDLATLLRGTSPMWSLSALTELDFGPETKTDVLSAANKRNTAEYALVEARQTEKAEKAAQEQAKIALAKQNQSRRTLGYSVILLGLLLFAAAGWSAYVWQTSFFDPLLWAAVAMSALGAVFCISGACMSRPLKEDKQTQYLNGNALPVEDAEEAYAQAQQEWQAWLHTLRLPEETPANSVYAIFSSIETAWTRLDRMEELAERQKTGHEAQQDCLAAAERIPLLRNILRKQCPDKNDTQRALQLAEKFIDSYRGTIPQRNRRREAALLAAEREQQALQLRAVREQELQKKQEIQQEVQHCQKEWRDWLTEQGLSSTLSPTTAVQALELSKLCLAAHNKYTQLKVQIEDVQRQISELQNEIRTLAEELSMPTALAEQPEALLIQLDRMRQDADEAIRMHTLREEKIQKMPQLQSSLTKIRAQVEETQERVRTLVEAGKSTSTEHYRSKVAAWQQRKEWEEEYQNCRVHLQDAATTLYPEQEAEHALQRLLTVLQTHTLEELEDKNTELNIAIRDTSEAEKQSVTRKGAIHTELKNLADSNQLNALQQQEANCLENLRQLSRKWTGLVLAEQALRKAKQRIEEENLPSLVRHASSLFATITEQQYSHLILSMDEGEIRAITARGEARSSSILSRGTQEQLYLAIRMAYIADHSQKAEPLPVVMDDILVNFDPKRTASTAKTLIEFANNGQQLLFFTCHPDTAKLLHKLSPEAPLYHINNGLITAQTQV